MIEIISTSDLYKDYKQASPLKFYGVYKKGGGKGFVIRNSHGLFTFQFPDAVMLGNSDLQRATLVELFKDSLKEHKIFEFDFSKELFYWLIE